MAIEDEVPDVGEFDRPDLTLAPETHHAQAEMAAERGEDYDPYEAERRAREWAEAAPDPFEDAEPVEQLTVTSTPLPARSQRPSAPGANVRP